MDYEYEDNGKDLLCTKPYLANTFEQAVQFHTIIGGVMFTKFHCVPRSNNGRYMYMLRPNLQPPARFRSRPAGFEAG